MLGESRGYEPKDIKSWWWNESIQSEVQIKKIIVLKSDIGVKLSKHRKSIRKVNETKQTESGEKLKFLTYYINL